MKILFFISGFMLPFPIFIDLSRWELVVHNVYEGGYLASAGWPVPIGLFSGLLLLGIGAAYGLTRSFPSKTWLYLGASLLSMIGFALYASLSLPVPRVISLILPVVCCILLAFFTAVRVLLIPSLRGYLCGLFAFLILHSSSAFYEMLTHFESQFYLFQSVFGFLIYQSLISYSAILSVIFCASFYHVIISRQKKTVFIMLLLGGLSIFLVILGQRKAFVMDLGLLAACVSFYLARDAFTRGFLSRRLLVALMASFFTMTLILIYSFNERGENIFDAAIRQRGFAYSEFYERLSSGGLYEFMFGYVAGWGGYSNIFIELIFRLGLLGMMLYIIAIFFALKVSVSIVENIGMDEPRGVFRYRRSPIWLFFIVSIVAANVINMNLQLPYYTINMIFIFLTFFYLHAILRGRSNRVGQQTAVDA